MKVKKLKFVPAGPSQVAETPVGTYEFWQTQRHRWRAHHDSEFIGQGKTRADAEAICQEHFERTVKDCLEDE